MPTTIVIQKIKALCDERQIHLALLHVPAWYECINKEQWLKIQIERPDVTKLDFTAPSRFIKKIGENIKVPVYDPSEILSRSNEPTYFPVFWHWNENGNKIVAEGLEKFLEAHKLLGPTSGNVSQHDDSD